MTVGERTNWLHLLLSFEVPVDDALAALQRYPWDCDELVTLTPEHISRVLRRFLAGELTARDVEQWAAAVECRDDVAMSELVKEVVFDLANPSLQGELNDDRAKLEIARLRRGQRGNNSTC